MIPIETVCANNFNSKLNHHFYEYMSGVFLFTGNLNSSTGIMMKSHNNFPDKNDSNYSAKLKQSTKCNKEEWNENSIEENDIYMNEHFTPNIPVDELESLIAENRSTGNEGFKKEYAV